jgi:hypothetical protein
MKTLRYNIVPLLLTFFVLTSCKQIRKSIDETLHPSEAKKAVPDRSNSVSSSTVSSSTIVSSFTHGETVRSIFDNAATLDSIQQKLHDMPGFKGKQLYFLNGFYFYDYNGGIISVDLQDPGNSENVDTYTYSNGEWEIQKPVKIVGNGHFPLEMLLMPLDDVKFSAAKKVYDMAVEKSKTIEDPKPIQHIYFNQLKAVRVKEWYVIIQGARRNYRLTFDINGSFREMKHL